MNVSRYVNVSATVAVIVGVIVVGLLFEYMGNAPVIKDARRGISGDLM